MTTLTASLLTVSVAAGPVVDSYRTDIDKFLGTKSSAMVTDSTDEDLYTYKSDYSSTTELLESIEDLGEQLFLRHILAMTSSPVLWSEPILSGSGFLSDKQVSRR